MTLGTEPTNEGGATPALLRDLRAALEQRQRAAEPASGAAAGADTPWPRVDALIDRLDRDLLPRTAGGHEHLVVGIVGPNNAGKSALFNALAGGVDEVGGAAAPRISPSLSTGGATRRLVGVLHPTLRAALEAEPTLRRFPMRGVTPGPDGVDAATITAQPGEASELLLVEQPGLVESLLLVDTPDFDSVLRENRAVTDALLAVADLAIVVVTRHTYQNHDVIEFLSRWLEHGRPWVLVYNESIDAETTWSHGEKIAEDLGGAPEAIFHAPFDVAVARREVALVPTRLKSPTQENQGDALCAWLRDLGATRDLKARALRASLGGLRDDLRSLGASARALSASSDELRDAARARAVTLGRAVAREAMPMGPFLEAFREVLDERPTAVQRELRKGLRWTGKQLSSGAKWVSGRVFGRDEAETHGDASPERATLLDAERKELGVRWTGFFEPALVELRAAGRSDALDARLRTALGPILGPILDDVPSAQAALARAEGALALDPSLMAEYRSACRDIIAGELDRQGGEWFLQFAVDALHLAPLGVAGAVIVHTGGLGADLAVAGGGAVSAALAERLSRTLGTGVAMAARSRWTELRSGRIADAAIVGLLGAGGEHAQQVRDEALGTAELAETWLRRFDWRAIEGAGIGNDRTRNGIDDA